MMMAMLGDRDADPPPLHRVHSSSNETVTRPFWKAPLSIEKNGPPMPAPALELALPPCSVPPGK